MFGYKKWVLKRMAELEAGAEVVETSKGLVEFEIFRRLIPNAKLHRMEGAYHIVWHSDLAPEMYHGQIEFLKKHLI